MALALTASLTLQLTATLTNAIDLSTPKDQIAIDLNDSLASGTAVDQADRMWHDRRTLSASSSENIDLAGSLTDALGQAFSPARVKVLLIHNRSTTAGDTLVVGGAASNAWEGWTTVAGSKFSVLANMVELKWCPAAAGFAVTAGTGDILKIENTSGSNSVTYDIIVIGASA